MGRIKIVRGTRHAIWIPCLLVPLALVTLACGIQAMPTPTAQPPVTPTLVPVPTPTTKAPEATATLIPTHTSAATPTPTLTATATPTDVEMKPIVKTTLLLTIVAVVAMATIGTALADGPGSDHSDHKEVKGIISAIQPAATSTPPTVTIQPVGGPAVTVKVVATTVITKAGLGKTTVDELEVGDVAVAKYNKTSFEASKISVSRPKAKHRGLEGTIKSIASPGATSTSFVLAHKKGDDLTINVNSQTKYKVPGIDDATLANFKVGDKVAVLAVELNSGWTALHVKLIPGKPIHVQRVGTIEAYIAPTATSTPGSITIKGKKGDLSTFVTTTDTKIKFKRGATAVTIGYRATVVARRYPGSDQFTAREIIVFGPKGHEGKDDD